MTEITREEALAHFGVKGMRWGVRNEKTTTSSISKKETIKKKPWRPTDKQKKIAAVGAIFVASIAWATYKDKKEYGNFVWEEILDERRYQRAKRANQVLVDKNSPIRDLYLR